MNNLGLSPAELYEIARRVCTEKQLDVLRLREVGLGWKRIALHLAVTPETVKEHHRAAVRNVVKEVERVEASGSGTAGEA